MVLGDPSPAYVLSQARLPGSHARRVMMRVVIALSVVELVSVFIPESHSYWTVIAAMAMLFQSNDRYASAVRSFQRVGGTGLGLVVYVLVTLLVDDAWIKLALFIVLRYVIEDFSPRNYGVGSICITVYGLLLLPVTADFSLEAIITQRLGETFLGVVVALVAVWWLYEEHRLL